MLSDVDPIFRADTEDALKDEMKNGKSQWRLSDYSYG